MSRSRVLIHTWASCYCFLPLVLRGYCRGVASTQRLCMNQTQGTFLLDILLSSVAFAPLSTCKLESDRNKHCTC